MRLPDQGDGLHFVTLAGIMDLQVNELFFGYEVIGSAPFRITRNSELYVNEEDADNLLEEIEEQVTKQRQADAVRLEIAPGAPDQLVSLLQQQFDLDNSLVFRVNGPVNLHRVMTLYGLVSRPALKDPPFTPRRARFSRRPRRLLRLHPRRATSSCITPTSRFLR